MTQCQRKWLCPPCHMTVFVYCNRKPKLISNWVSFWFNNCLTSCVAALGSVCFDMWADSILNARSCACTAQPWMVLSYAIEPCILQLQSAVEAYSEQHCQLHTPSVCRPSTLCCQKALAYSKGMCCQCLTALVTHSYFSSSLASLEQEHCIKYDSARDGGKGHSSWKRFITRLPSEDTWHYISWRVKPSSVYLEIK